jgi:hypothetical protein
LFSAAKRATNEVLAQPWYGRSSASVAKSQTFLS